MIMIMNETGTYDMICHDNAITSTKPQLHYKKTIIYNYYIFTIFLQSQNFFEIFLNMDHVAEDRNLCHDSAKLRNANILNYCLIYRIKKIYLNMKFLLQKKNKIKHKTKKKLEY